MSQELIMKLQDQKTTNFLEHCVISILALVAMLMLTDTFAICGPEKTAVLLFQMVGYLPQAIFMVLGPFLTYIVCQEPVPARWRRVKLIVIGILFTASMIVTVKYGQPVLVSEFGSAEIELLAFPMLFYCQLIVSLMNMPGRKIEGGRGNVQK